MTAKQQQVEVLTGEIQILQKKLDSKSKAFAILINELETLKHERDQFKSLVDSLQEKCVQLKKQGGQKVAPLGLFDQSQTAYEYHNDSTVHLLKSALKSIQDEKEILQRRIDELTRELNDAKGDLSIFRQKRHRTRLSSDQDETNGVEGKRQSNDERTMLLQRLEQSNVRISELDNDLKLVMCQKEELEIERDSFKTKYSKLNQELNKMLNGNDKRVIDIELILSENRYLKEKINELNQEKNLALANAGKYKDLLQTHRSAYNSSGKMQSSGSILTHKQVRSLLNQSYLAPTTPETENDLRSIAEALYENIKDKNVTIVHQRKTNKVLANRVAELEKLLAETHLSTHSDQTNSLIHLLDRTPSPSVPDTATSQFVNSVDESQQPSPTQMFSFSSPWPTSPPPSTSKIRAAPTSTKSTLECHQSRKTSAKSDSIDLEMDDPLQSPTLAASIAYLEERDLIPPLHSKLLDLTPSVNDDDDDVDQLHGLLNAALDKNHSLQSKPSTSTVTNLSC